MPERIERHRGPAAAVDRAQDPVEGEQATGGDARGSRKPRDAQLELETLPAEEPEPEEVVA